MAAERGARRRFCHGASRPQRREANTLSEKELSENRPPESTDAVALDHSTSGAPEVEIVEELVASAPVSEENPTFTSLGVRAETVAALAEVGIERAFAIQELTLPLALAGSDVIGHARTGTGKTLGFGIPLLERILDKSEGADGVPQALVVVPTRELCVQVTRDINVAGKTRGIRVLDVYGGRAYEPQVSALRRGIDVVVGTPGRLLDLAEQGHLVLGKVSILVLDEADEMLDLGFLPDVERILSRVPDRRQTMLFSATMPGPILTLARAFMDQPVHVTAEEHHEARTVPTTAQHVYRTHPMNKAATLARVLQARDRGLVMVFCRTKRAAQSVSDELVTRGFAAAAVHGDLGQGAREQALRAFRAGKVDVLVATDVAARGIDVVGVTHVVNYDCPEDEKTYLHRIGRTGRAGAHGVAITFVDWDELSRWKSINTTLGLPFDDPVETYSTSPHLFAELDIPESVSGALPRSQRTRAGLDAEQVEDLGETGGRRRQRSRGKREDKDKATTEQQAAPAGPSRTRSRRRTRSGVPLSGESEPDTQQSDVDESTPDNQESPKTPRRRTRRRVSTPDESTVVDAQPPTTGGHGATPPPSTGLFLAPPQLH